MTTTATTSTSTANTMSNNTNETVMNATVTPAKNFETALATAYGKSLTDKGLAVIAEIISCGSLSDLKTNDFNKFSIAEALDRTENPKAFGGSLASLKKRLADTNALIYIEGEKPDLFLCVSDSLYEDAFEFAHELGFDFEDVDAECAEDDPEYLAAVAAETDATETEEEEVETEDVTDTDTDEPEIAD